MSYRNFLDDLGKGMPLTSYLLVSSDPFLLSEAVSAIKAKVPEAEVEFSFHCYDLTDSSCPPFEQIIDVVNTVPFFGGRKSVVLENVQKMTKKDYPKLKRYLSRPSEASLFVLLYSGTVKKEFKDAIEGVKQIILDISEKDIPLWLKTKAKAKGLNLNEDAADYLIDSIGPDLGLLSSEIEKLVLIGSRDIGKDDLVDIIEAKRNYNAFALVDALRSGNVDKAFKIYSVLKETEEPYNLLGALNWQYGRQPSSDQSQAERDYQSEVFNVLKEADVAIKSSGGAYPVEHLIFRLLRISRPR